MAVTGTKPRADLDEQQAARWVRQMFGRVAPRYDLLNRLLSFQIDRYWRWRTVRELRPLLRPGARVIDLACGTGDLLRALQAAAPHAVFGSDFSHPMLLRSRAKTAAPLLEADALRLPLRDASIDLITVAFGFRNYSNYRNGLREALRVLKPGGTLAILEFSQPPNSIVDQLYRFYSDQILCRVGAWISGDAEAYRYLPESVKRFPGAEELAADMRKEGFGDVRFLRLTFGVAALHLGRKA